MKITKGSQYRFNPPPGWPVPPDFIPGTKWKPDPDWPHAPLDWKFWLPIPGTEQTKSLKVRWLLVPKRYALGFLLLTGIAYVTSEYPQVVAIWTVDRPFIWAQSGAVLGGVVAVWVLIRAISVTHLVGATSEEDWDDDLYVDIIKLAVERVGFFSLTGTFIALLAASGVGSNGVKATSLLGDLATIGALIGLFTCIPESLRASRRSLKALRFMDSITWIRAHILLTILDLFVAAHVLVVLIEAIQGHAFPGTA